MKQRTTVALCQFMPVSCSTAGQGTKEETHHCTSILIQPARTTACIMPTAACGRRHGQAKAVEDAHGGCREDHGKEALQHPGGTTTPVPELIILLMFLVVLGGSSKNSLTFMIILSSRSQPHVLRRSSRLQLTC